MRSVKEAFSEFLGGHKRWWVFLFLVVLLCLILILFGQSTRLVSFIYALF